MGCGGSKEKADIRSLKLERIGVYSIDAFSGRVTDVIERFASIADDLKKRRVRLEDLTGFNRAGIKTADRTLNNAVLGMLLQFFAVCNGSYEKIVVTFKERRPYIDIKVNGLSLSNAEDQIQALVDYIETLHESVEKLPGPIEEMEQLLRESENLQANAQSEFDAMNDFAKIGAVAKAVGLIAELPKIPSFMK